MPNNLVFGTCDAGDFFFFFFLCVRACALNAKNLAFSTPNVITLRL